MESLVGVNIFDSNSEIDKLNEEPKDENNKNDLIIPTKTVENWVKIKGGSVKEALKSVNFITFLMFSPKTYNKQSIKKKRKTKIFLARKKNRKEMSDIICKKIKSHFFKSLRNILIDKLKKEKDNKNEKEKTFKFLKTFTQDASLKTNNSYWDEELYDFTKEKLVGNKEKILEYLQKNKIGRMTLRDIYKEYLLSQEFENDLPDENEGQDYINKYKNKANDFINYYTKNRKINNSNNMNLCKETEKKSEPSNFYISNDNLDILPLINNGNDNDKNFDDLSNSHISELNLNIFQ